MRCQCCNSLCVRKRPKPCYPFNWYCEECTTLYVPLYDPKIYDEKYRDDYLQRLNSPTNDPIQKIRWDMVTSWVGEEGGQVMDIGCGVGAFMRKCPFGYTIVGQEINPTCVEHCNNDGLKVFNELPSEPTEEFFKLDAVTMFDVLEHFDDLRILETVKSYLREGGMLFITVPNFTEELLSDITSWKHYKPYEHVHLFSEKSIRAICDRYGYEFGESNFDESTIRKPYGSIASYVLIKT